MVRRASGMNVLDKAKDLLSRARTLDELRQAQAVILPLEYGLTLSQTAAVIGVSKGWACRIRTEFILADGEVVSKQPSGGRRRENMSRDEENEFLAPFMEKVRCGDKLVVSEVREALQERLGRAIALTSVYNLLRRHDWRKRVSVERTPMARRNVRNDSKHAPCEC